MSTIPTPAIPAVPADHDVEGFAFDAFHVGDQALLPAVLPAVHDEGAGLPLIRGSVGSLGWDVHGWDRTGRKAG